MSLTLLSCSVCQVPQAVEEHIGSKWTATDLLPVNGTEEEVEALREAVLKSRAAAKAARLEKKAGKAARKQLPQEQDSDRPVSQAVVADSLKRSLEVRADCQWLGSCRCSQLGGHCPTVPSAHMCADPCCRRPLSTGR